MAPPSTLFSIGLGTVIIFWARCYFSKKHPPLPPGPLGDPIIGNVRSIPSDDQDLFFYELGKKYGSVSYLSVLCQPFIVLNSVESAVELLDKRGTNYSGRPRFPLTEVIGFRQALVFLNYGADFRLHRKMLQKYYAKDKILPHRRILIQEARILVQNLASKPQNREIILLRFSTAIIIAVSYGHRIKDDDDPYLKVADDMCRLAVPTITPPEGTVVDILPWLQHFPSWFPGTYHVNRAKEARKYVRRLYEYPYNDVKRKLADGTAKPSFLATQLEELQNGEIDAGVTIEHIQGASAITYVAGSETTSSTLSIFIFAMLLYPECQIKAQEEIDRVIGSGRLPEFSDRESLPYVESVLQETQRWHPTVPMGVPHYSIEDDVYNGMFIPKGSIIIANARGMTLDENVYYEPFMFNPDRFFPKPIGRGEPHPPTSFGFGRRICPGRYLADDSLWIAMATILATLSISKAIGADGKEITPELKFDLGVTSQPHPFDADIHPRNAIAGSLIAQVMNEIN
ncbi:O-methylsterigmatocystin oxidoreductase [Termitomyces sp. T112]|nr:O-methylsterigmatocystin oxidoreductase [Termitomyces sp. T112]